MAKVMNSPSNERPEHQLVGEKTQRWETAVKAVDKVAWLFLKVPIEEQEETQAEQYHRVQDHKGTHQEIWIRLLKLEHDTSLVEG